MPGTPSDPSVTDTDSAPEATTVVTAREDTETLPLPVRLGTHAALHLLRRGGR